MAVQSTGNCYLCGATLGKTAMKNHIVKSHEAEEGGQECCLLKIEGAYNKEYWLYIDVPVETSLAKVDDFLRAIWLECCGHLSEFCYTDHVKISKNRKLETFAVGEKFFHHYDFGTTTETVITVMGKTRRKPQKNKVRLLARNTPPVFQCEICGKTAEYICGHCSWQSENPFFCAECGKAHEEGEGMMLPVTNSPRMGECGYGGEYDTFAFDPASIG